MISQWVSLHCFLLYVLLFATNIIAMLFLPFANKFLWVYLECRHIPYVSGKNVHMNCPEIFPKSFFILFSNLVCMILPVLQILVLHGISTSNWPAFSVHLSRSINNNTQLIRIWNLWRNLYTFLQKSVKEGLDPSKMLYSVCLTQSKQIEDTRLQLDATARYPNHLVQVPTWPRVFLVIYMYI